MAELSLLADDGTELLLDGDAAMPERGIDVGVSLRAVETWYPGASTPSVQIMGTKEEPISLKGTWRDDLLAEIGGAQSRANVCRQLVLRQVPATLLWTADDGTAPLSRTVLVKSYVTTFRRADSLGWSLTLQPLTATESEVVAIPAPPLADLYALSDAVRALVVAAELVAEAIILTSNVLQAVA